MTIITPKKNNWRGIFLLFGLGGAALFTAIVAIRLYSGIVDARHTVHEGERAIKRLALENADLKNELFAMLNAGSLEEKADDFGLVLDRRPAFIKIKSEAVAKAL